MKKLKELNLSQKERESINWTIEIFKPLSITFESIKDLKDRIRGYSKIYN